VKRFQKHPLAAAIGAALKETTSQKLKPIVSVFQATFVGFAFATGTAVLAKSAHAQDEPGAELSKRNYRIPAGPLDPALSRFAAETDVLRSFDPALQSLFSPGSANHFGSLRAVLLTLRYDFKGVRK